MRGQGTGQSPQWTNSLSRPRRRDRPPFPGFLPATALSPMIPFNPRAGLGPHPGAQAPTPHVPASLLGVSFSRTQNGFRKSLSPSLYLVAQGPPPTLEAVPLLPPTALAAGLESEPSPLLHVEHISSS